jgi:hypothetical protein
VFAIGDSVMLRAADALRALSGREVTVDAEVGRQFRAGIAPVTAAVAAGATVVVVHLGTNGPFSEDTFEQMVAAAGGAKLVFVTIQLPDATYPHEGPTNALLRDGAARHGAAIVDWNELTNGRPDLLAVDGYHMSPSGIPEYVALLTPAL